MSLAVGSALFFLLGYLLGKFLRHVERFISDVRLSL